MDYTLDMVFMIDGEPARHAVLVKDSTDEYLTKLAAKAAMFDWLALRLKAEVTQ
jgi:hypothetical protein